MVYEATCIRLFYFAQLSLLSRPLYIIGRQTGLTHNCLTSPYTKSVVSRAILSYVKKWIPYPRIGVLAGNSVHADRSFLLEEMPELIDWLHYRYEVPRLEKPVLIYSLTSSALLVSRVH
jgi:oligoribonuclease (3'-5' exoribonuclease)